VSAANTVTTATILAESVAELARLGTSTVYEASGRRGLIDDDFLQLIPGSHVAGPARIAECGQGDNRAVHELISHLQPGEIVVLTMPEAAPVALIGDLLVTQLRENGAAGVLVDAAVRDADELAELGLPIWTKWIRSHGATKITRGRVNVSVEIGGTTINPGDIIVLDRDGAVAVPSDDIDRTLELTLAREKKEAASREQYLAGNISYDLYGFRAEDEEGD
jgi:4-hydroxy-4-methyl-2-oxoglutarate aldolase